MADAQAPPGQDQGFEVPETDIPPGCREEQVGPEEAVGTQRLRLVESVVVLL